MLEGSPGASFLNGCILIRKRRIRPLSNEEYKQILHLFVNKGGTAMSLVLFWMRGIFILRRESNVKYGKEFTD
ncbi:hypothetical protein CG478_017670 [Bacillus cytotoxicus]|nr:hypothetical protein CG483_017670 [Bacillus cytotoxicus]AWC34042.1 hypothetical protein CG482_017625 [Bacillus cytotoxicus]AWC38041.1 hypothetical protein CG481_017475 [Bacillus cytotoxicus]AWC42133.1 hypothetical protein CG480_017670 [Bacillus cytotoxicus]AWC46023.1 hypothetical protein CG479_016870 [Bacillus cytotoxicus]